MKLYRYGYLSAIMIHTSTHPCTSNSIIPAWQKINQSCITSLTFALPDWPELLPNEQYWSVTSKCPEQSQAHPASYSIGSSGLSQGVKWLGCEKSTHLHYGAEVKNIWSCISILLYVFTTWMVTTLNLPSCRSTTWDPFECTHTHFESWYEINLKI